MRSYLERFLPGLVIITALVFAGGKYLYALSEVLDIDLADESKYLYRGVDLLHSGFSPATWAPMYSSWYFLLSLVQPDRVQLYYLNVALLTILLPVLLFVLLRRYQVSLLVAACAAFLFLISNANLGVMPRVNHLALVILLVALLIASFTKSLSKRFAIVGLGALVASYARPELYYAFILAGLVSLGLALRARDRWAGILSALVLLAAIPLGQLLGVPLSGAQRTLTAFGQHYSLNWITWTNNVGRVSPWSDWQRIIQNDFGDARNLLDVVRANPAQFFRHVSANIANLPSNLFALLAYHANVFLPEALRAQEAWLWPLLAAFALILRRDRLLPQFKRHQDLLLLLGFISIIPIGVTLIIYPRAHYLVPIAALVLVALGLLLDIQPPHGNGIWIALVIGIVLVAATPRASNLLGPSEHPVSDTIHFFQALQLKGTVRLLEAGGRGYEVYLPNTHSIAHTVKKKPFNTFLRERKINAILLSDRLVNDVRYRDDPQWKAFLSNYAERGFQLLTTPDGTRLLVASELLKSSP
ncbi:MAG: hypothetical protein HY741_15395 [Chloroflexi bacterium]|nr:hypothetical protein [Chloroflexota bacterium]